MRTIPGYAPTPRPAMFAVTVTVPGVLPLDGLTDSQPEADSAEVVKPTPLAPFAPVTEMVCVGGLVPDWALNVSVVLSTLMLPEPPEPLPDGLYVTETVWAVLPLPVRVMLHWLPEDTA